jgi:hypothetical protein
VSQLLAHPLQPLSHAPAGVFEVSLKSRPHPWKTHQAPSLILTVPVSARTRSQLRHIGFSSQFVRTSPCLPALV